MKNLIAFKDELDKIDNQAEVKIRIHAKIIELRMAGYSDEEILQIFEVERITEAQGNVEMIRNHQEYVAIVQQILSDKK